MMRYRLQSSSSDAITIRLATVVKQASGWDEGEEPVESTAGLVGGQVVVPNSGTVQLGPRQKPSRTCVRAPTITVSGLRTQFA